jgi:hypothetical protein
MTIKVPFADVAGHVAVLLEKLRESDFALAEVRVMSTGNPTPNAITIGSASSEDRRS